jgi:nucleotide-binding universal stress UspA family protein
MLSIRSILAAVDFSDASRSALRLAARLARRCHATLHVLHVEDPLLVAAASQSGIDLTAQSREELQRLVDGIPESTTVTPRLHVVVGGPAHAILTTAARESVDLIVVAAHGMSGIKRVVFGSVTRQLLLQSSRSVLVVPDDWTLPEDLNETGLGPIVVGNEATGPSLTAARAAARLAPLLNTTVEAVHVVPALNVLERWRPHAEKAMTDLIELAERDTRQFLALTVPEIKAVSVRVGDVAEQLAQAAQQRNGHRPLLVLGRDEPDGAPGATAQRAAAIAAVPVLMCQECGSD